MTNNIKADLAALDRAMKAIASLLLRRQPELRRTQRPGRIQRAAGAVAPDSQRTPQPQPPEGAVPALRSRNQGGSELMPATAYRDRVNLQLKPSEWKAVRMVQEKARQTLGMEILPAQALHILIECGAKAYFGKQASK
jgi:hypothetical protein